MRAFQFWKECSTRVHMNEMIDAEHQEIIKNEVEYWKEVFKCIVYMTETLGSQNLEFQGASDKLYDINNGNFLKLLEFVGKLDIIIAKHLWRILLLCQNKQINKKQYSILSVID